MKTIKQTKHQQRALKYLEDKGLRTVINWDNPREADFEIFEELKAAGLLVNRYGDHCTVYNEYGPNSFGVEKPSDINRVYEI